MSRLNQVHAATSPSVSERVLVNVYTITKPYKTYSFIPFPSMKEPEIRALVTNRQGSARKGSKGPSLKPIEKPRMIKPGVRVHKFTKDTGIIPRTACRR